MARSSLRKCLSMGSAAALRIDRHPHDYRHHGNRQFAVDSGTTTVKLWVSWCELQASRRPRSWQESWRQLNESPGNLPLRPPFSHEPALRNLDRQIAAANADGVEVVLALDECSPPWAVVERAMLPQGTSRCAARESGARPPLDRSPAGPWAWFLEHLCARYRRDAPPNPFGPQEPAAGERCDGYDPFVGNPDGAHVTAIEILHEPNLRWPQKMAHVAAAEMIRTAAEIALHHDGPTILAPSLSDLPARWLTGRFGHGTPHPVFARRLLRELRGWTPAARVEWSQHNYGDLSRAGIAGVEEVLELLEGHGWHDLSYGLWLTEGAIATANPASATIEEALHCERMQAQLLRLNYDLLCDLDEIRLWSYHTIHDLANEPDKLGLRQDFDWDRQAPGAEKIAWDCFVELPGDYAASDYRGAQSSALPAA